MILYKNHNDYIMKNIINDMKQNGFMEENPFTIITKQKTDIESKK